MFLNKETVTKKKKKLYTNMLKGMRLKNCAGEP